MLVQPTIEDRPPLPQRRDLVPVPLRFRRRSCRRHHSAGAPPPLPFRREGGRAPSGPLRGGHGRRARRVCLARPEARKGLFKPRPR